MEQQEGGRLAVQGVADRAGQAAVRETATGGELLHGRAGVEAEQGSLGGPTVSASEAVRAAFMRVAGKHAQHRGVCLEV